MRPMPQRLLSYARRGLHGSFALLGFVLCKLPPSRTVSRDVPDVPGSSSKQLSLHSLKSKVLRILTHCDFETGRWMRSQRPCRLRTCCILSRPGDRKLFAQVHLVMRRDVS